jgi:hypothetical protein
LRLHITQDKIELVRELWGTKIKLPTPAKKEYICLIQRITNHVKHQPVYLQDLWSLAHPTTIINKSH